MITIYKRAWEHSGYVDARIRGRALAIGRINRTNAGWKVSIEVKARHYHSDSIRQLQTGLLVITTTLDVWLAAASTQDCIPVVTPHTFPAEVGE